RMPPCSLISSKPILTPSRKLVPAAAPGPDSSTIEPTFNSASAGIAERVRTTAAVPNNFFNISILPLTESRICYGRFCCHPDSAEAELKRLLQLSCRHPDRRLVQGPRRC